MAEFIGLRVKVDLINGQVVEGMIEAVAQDANLLLLSNAGGTKFPRLELSGDQINSIDIVDESDSPSPQLEETSPLATGHRSQPQTFIHPPKILSRKDRKSPQKVSEWSKDDVKSYKSKEFDFQANLNLFDKEKVFSEIRATDDIRSEDRLASYNMNMSAQKTLQPNESGSGNETNSYGSNEDRIMLSTAIPRSLTLSKSLPSSLVESIEQQLIYGGVISVEQMIENAGRSLAEFLFQRVRDNLLKTQGSPIVLYTSVDRLGAFALCTGRTLSNRGMKVVAFISGDIQKAPIYFNHAVSGFRTCKGEIVTKVPDSASLVITSLSTSVPVKSPTCALVPYSTADWHIRFGLPSGLPSATSSGAIVLCDAGWPTSLVNQLLKSSGYSYEKSFGLSSFIVLNEGIYP